MGVGASRDRSMHPFAVTIVLASGQIETYFRPVSAQEVMLRYPKHLVVCAEQFQLDAVKAFVSPEAVLTPGNRFYLVPCRALEGIPDCQAQSNVNHQLQLANGKSKQKLTASPRVHVKDRPEIFMSGTKCWAFRGAREVQMKRCSPGRSEQSRGGKSPSRINGNIGSVGRSIAADHRRMKLQMPERLPAKVKERVDNLSDRHGHLVRDHLMVDRQKLDDRLSNHEVPSIINMAATDEYTCWSLAECLRQPGSSISGDETDDDSKAFPSSCALSEESVSQTEINDVRTAIEKSHVDHDDNKDDGHIRNDGDHRRKHRVTLADHIFHQLPDQKEHRICSRYIARSSQFSIAIVPAGGSCIKSTTSVGVVDGSGKDGNNLRRHLQMLGFYENLWSNNPSFIQQFRLHKRAYVIRRGAPSTKGALATTKSMDGNSTTYRTSVIARACPSLTRANSCTSTESSMEHAAETSRSAMTEAFPGTLPRPSATQESPLLIAHQRPLYEVPSKSAGSLHDQNSCGMPPSIDSSIRDPSLPSVSRHFGMPSRRFHHAYLLRSTSKRLSPIIENSPPTLI